MQRPSNEDNLCASVGPNAPPGTDALLAVADGMGGHRAGEVASSMAIHGLRDRLAECARVDSTHPAFRSYAQDLAAVVQKINADVRRAAEQPDTHGMATTLTAALVVGPSYVVAHVGDSRAYLWRKGKLRPLTQDHSWVAEEVARGALTIRQARDHPSRNIVTRGIGSEPSVRVDLIEGELREGDVLLLCSDGLHSLVPGKDISLILGREDPQESCASLVDRANERGGQDNITVVVARMDKLIERRAVQRLPDLHQETTIQIGPMIRKRSRIAQSMRVATIPLQAPMWIIAQLVRVANHRRK